MPRNSKGQFTSSSDISIPLPSLIGLYKILIIGFLIFPWYAIISNNNLSNVLFNYILGTNYTNLNCPKCEECEDCPDCKCECPKPEPKCEASRVIIRELLPEQILAKCGEMCQVCNPKVKPG